ncbi:MAG: menaquinone biosynthesis decarboxylase, partial [Rikenellaceae bacterium]|nr:menaquinone biosynthesis decarboxylase [Rikenellaceae bacterium]
MYKNLTTFIEVLRQNDELAEIDAPVSPELEITEITDRISKQPGGGKALLFHDTGTDFPLLINMMGSDRRICLALGVNRLEDLAERIYELFGKVVSPKPTLADKARLLPVLGKASRWLPRRKSGRGACQQIRMDQPDLSRLPILRCWPHDGGRFITLPLVHTQDPESGARNVGMYRMQVFSEDSTGMHWHLHKTGARHYEAYKKRGERMPATVCLGGDPIYTYCSTAPLPEGIDEYLLAGFIRQKPVELVRCLTNELEVPADCDFVIEGYVDPTEEKVTEGPFGDHTGFYSLEDRYPVFHITCITYRQNAVYPATIVGVPPQEDLYIGKATEAIFLAPIRLAVQPEIRQLYLPAAGVMHNIALVNIQKSYPGQGFKVAHSLWGAGQMMFNKFCLVLSTEKSVYDPTAVCEALREVQIPRDLLFSKGPLDVLDHTASGMDFGGKCCIDATPKDWEGEKTEPLPVSLPHRWQFPEGITGIEETYASDWAVLVVTVRKGTEHLPGLMEQLLACNAVRGIKFLLVFDSNVPLAKPEYLLWLAASHCDAVRDLFLLPGTLVLDARIKAGGVNGFSRPWPHIVTMDRQTIRQVDRRWPEYGLGPRISSPSLSFPLPNRQTGAVYNP